MHGIGAPGPRFIEFSGSKIRTTWPRSAVYGSITSIWVFRTRLSPNGDCPIASPKSYRDRLLITLWALDSAGRFHEEISVAQTQLVLNQRDPNRLAYLCSAYAATGQIEEARLTGERLRGLQTEFDSTFDFQDCQFYIDVVTGNRPDALRFLHIWESEYPDNPLSGPNITGISAAAFGASYVLLGDFDKASSWFERAYERRQPDFFAFFFNRGFGYESALEKYRLTSGYKALAAKPLFKEWQAEHDRIAAALAAHRDPLN
jgi:tetratricopeptide (TPR) repeat protein